MDFLQNMMSTVSNWFSGATSGVSNFFGNLFSGGSGPSVGPGPSMATPGIVAVQPPAPTYPQYPVNVHNPYSVQQQSLNILGRGAQAVADRIGGVGGAVFGTLAAGTIATSGAAMAQDVKIAAAQQREAMWRANSQGAISLAPAGQPMGPTPNMGGQFGAVAGPVPLSERLIQAKHDGIAAMNSRTLNQAQTELWQRVIPSVNHPGGAFGKLLSKL